MKIAVSVSKAEKEKGEKSQYFQALRQVGVPVEEIELVTAGDRWRPEKFDGVVLAGGEDVDPALYGEKKKYDSVRFTRARDDFEMGLFDSALKRRLPVLGICRGAQVINVKFGGTLYQDLEQEKNIKHRQEGRRDVTAHAVTLTDPDSRLAEVFKGNCLVNSMHHQAINRLGHGLKVSAHSEDGLVEAVESAGDYPYLVAVQWHPEEIVHQPEQRELFARFVAKCREHAGQRARQARSL